MQLLLHVDIVYDLLSKWSIGIGGLFPHQDSRLGSDIMHSRGCHVTRDTSCCHGDGGRTNAAANGGAGSHKHRVGSVGEKIYYHNLQTNACSHLEKREIPLTGISI